ncbi:hypothetical protein [Nesterenkonia pannonica]|uniref:hypothetical protein n=1 Tax=Nesterenkonia pannonica TaxID=1548602 RepID=UPI002164D235|nr:hypothetical protein [Nesterenkonia pannonica]
MRTPPEKNLKFAGEERCLKGWDHDRRGPTSKHTSWAYAEEHLPESDPAVRARALARELGVSAVTPAPRPP